MSPDGHRDEHFPLTDIWTKFCELSCDLSMNTVILSTLSMLNAKHHVTCMYIIPCIPHVADHADIWPARLRVLRVENTLCSLLAFLHLPVDTVAMATRKSQVSVPEAKE